ncbi:uncharacterized protein LOC121855419 [Homarus americanus]|uniref:uncharacterized protein LOC121855419 n=1 Tax=Homarus americanus TaxID=6706 RepID=UPI001C474CA9|nr:uncharacterized protein LOC121855419 [Homarus americanus]
MFAWRRVQNEGSLFKMIFVTALLMFVLLRPVIIRISLASLHKVMVKTGNELPFANKSTRLDSEVADDVPWLLHADIYAFYNRKTGELEHLTNDSLHLDMTAYVEYLGECLQRDLPVLEEADYPPNVTSVFAAMRDEILVPFTCLVFISKDTVDESACIFYRCGSFPGLVEGTEGKHGTRTKWKDDQGEEQTAEDGDYKRKLDL